MTDNDDELDFDWPWGQLFMLLGFTAALIMNIVAVFIGPWAHVGLICSIVSYLGARYTLINLSQTIEDLAEESKRSHK